MKFEKISDSKFKGFEKNEVVNPIHISGGWVDTDAGHSHDRFNYTAAGGGLQNIDNYQQTRDGSTFSGDAQ